MTAMQPDPAAKPQRRSPHPLLAAWLLAALTAALYAMYLRWNADPVPYWTRFANPVMFLSLGVMHLVTLPHGKHRWVFPTMFFAFGGLMLLDALISR